MRWSNVPVPEPHVAAIIGAAVLHSVLALPIPIARRTRWLLAGPILAGGIGLVAWAVTSAGNADVERDSALVTHGAYALSRNPMYLGWSSSVLGLALGTGSAWLLAGWIVAVRALDREIDVEESRLRARFGPACDAYLDAVPRYLALPSRRSWLLLAALRTSPTRWSARARTATVSSHCPYPPAR